mmetsp:Transcript_70909/g.167164  ORF Transcript_70909/g.167164 Transcript_70909/m.167164 type:complete len:457 (+) Transcript_70909:296-1666(+)
MECRFPTMKKLSAVSRDAAPAPDKTFAVKMERTYTSDFEEGVEVPAEQRIKGYKYGKSRVPLSSVEEKMQSAAEKCLQVLGFTPMSRVLRHQLMGAVDIFAAEKDDVAGANAIAALSQALRETNRAAIVRYVKREAPILGFLASGTEQGIDCLFFCQLPFAEDIRHFGFAPLSGRASCDVSTTQLDVAERLIQDMDMGPDRLVPERTYNPCLQYFYRCVQHRALNPDDDLPPIPPHLQAPLLPDPTLTVKCAASVAAFKSCFTLSVVEEKSKGKRRVWADVAIGDDPTDTGDADDPSKKAKTGPISLDSMLGATVVNVGEMNPVGDFKTMMQQRDSSVIDRALEQMQGVVLRTVEASVQDSLFPKALQCIVALREACAKGDGDESEVFNDFLRKLKAKFGPPHKFWPFFVERKVTLIPNATDSEADAAAFLAHVAPVVVAAPPPPPTDDDLFDEAD